MTENKQNTGRARPTDSVARRGIGSSRPVAIVGMGASAGGLEAFQKFFECFQDDSDLAFVLVQHFDPHQETLFPEILSRHSSLSFREAKDQDSPAPSSVYVISPGTMLTIEDGCLRVRKMVEARGHRRPIDYFLRSLAEDQGERAVGIVLSGTGSDGMLGLQAIKEHGGLTIAQSPDSAKYDSMPRNAISLGIVDQVLPPAEMPALLSGYTRQMLALDQNAGREHAEDIDARVAEICRILYRKIQHDFSQYKRSTLVRRIKRRMLILDVQSLEQYQEILRREDDEARQLFKDLLVSVTTFFRDPESFEALQGIIRKLVAEAPSDDRVRVWVPGCASGEEAYSLAMLFVEEQERADKVRGVQIFATDIDEAALKIAREGCYLENIAADISAERLQRFFTWRGDHYQVVKALREMCIFSAHNLTHDPPFSRIDLLSCRNVLIYLQSELQDRLMPRFHYALRSGGYLFLGPAENIGQHTGLFRPVDKKHRIFQARDVAHRPDLIFPLMPGASTPGWSTKQLHMLRRPVRPARDLSALHQRAVLEMSGFKSVLIDESYKIIDLCGRLGTYLEPGWGPVGDNLMELARRELRVHLRTAIHKAQKSGEEEVVPDLSILINGVVQRFQLIVRRFSHAAADGDLWLVIFRELEQPRLVSQAEDIRAVASEDPLVRELESELESTREHLQSTVEELETSNEELTSTVEELLSMNEELQSSNEELQTAKEELQSVNEELETVNVELQSKIEALDRTHSDLRNLFESTRIPTLFLDRELRIKLFTPTMQEVLHLIRADMGRPLEDISPRVEGANLVGECRAVLDTVVPREVPVRRSAGGEGPEQRYLVRIFPYRTSAELIDGVVLAFVDITELERATEAALQREQQQAAVAKLGLEALSGVALDELQHDAVALVQRALQVDQAEALALLPGVDGESRPFDVLGAHSRHERALSQQDADFLQTVANVMGSAADRQRATDHLRESERRMRLAVEALEAGVFELSLPTGEDVYPSERWAQIIGRSREELPPPERFRDWLREEVVHPEDLETLGRACRDFIAGRMPKYRGEARLRHKDGRWIWVNIVAIATAHDDQGRVRRITGLMWDVKEAQERLEEASRQKDIFLAMLGHELRNPLAAIRSGSELLRQLGGREPRIERIRSVLDRQTTHMTRLIDGLLDVSRIAQGKLILQTEVVDLSAIVSEALEDLGKRIQERGLTLHTDLAREPLWVEGDRTRLIQVFDNLVSNAIKFTEAPGTITITARHQGESAVITVHDTGIGIDPSMKARLFQPFQQAPQSIARTSGGLGLGLALVKGIVELHGGQIEIHSEGRGTEFRVRIPCATPLRHEEGERAPEEVVAPMRMLVVEDNEDSALMLRYVLELAGHHVDVAGTGTEAIELAGQHRPDVVLCDLGLPGMNGYEVARAIRSDESFRGTILIALTGYGQPEDRQQADEAGFDAHLVKPADLGTIHAVLARLLKDAAAGRG